MLTGLIILVSSKSGKIFIPFNYYWNWMWKTNYVGEITKCIPPRQNSFHGHHGSSTSGVVYESWDNGVTMVKDVQSCICPLPVHHKEADLIIFVLPGKISSLLHPRQRRQKMLVLEVSHRLV